MKDPSSIQLTSNKYVRLRRAILLALLLAGKVGIRRKSIVHALNVREPVMEQVMDMIDALHNLWEEKDFSVNKDKSISKQTYYGLLDVADLTGIPEEDALKAAKDYLLGDDTDEDIIAYLVEHEDKMIAEIGVLHQRCERKRLSERKSREKRKREEAAGY